MRPTRLLFFLLLAAFAALGWAEASGESDALRYSASTEPSRPEIGGRLTFSLDVEGLSASTARLAELRLDPGLGLESESIRPIVRDSSRGTSFRFELRVLEAGKRRIESLVVTAAEGSLSLGPIVVCEVPTGEAAQVSALSPDLPAAWLWVAPSEAFRFESFSVRLEPIGAVSGARSPVAYFASPPGASFESSGELSWTVTVFEGSELVLPSASLGKEAGKGLAMPQRVLIKPLPPEIASTRAIGEFAISLERDAPSPVPPPLQPGSALRFRLVLKGRGNLVAVLLPEPQVSLDGLTLPRDGGPRGAWTTARSDAWRAEGGSYVGSTSLLIEVLPRKPGLLSLRFPPLPVLDPRSGVALHEIPPLELRIGRTTAPARILSAKDGGKLLAEAYGAFRRARALSPQAQAAKKAALALAAELGTAPPLLDALPPPPIFIIPAFFVATGALALFIQGRRRAQRGRPTVALAILTLALALFALGIVSAEERNASFVVIWDSSLRAVPSSASELRVPVVKGSTARARGGAEERGVSCAFESVILRDGVEGWVPLDSLYWY